MVKRPVTVASSCNPSYSGGTAREVLGLRPDQAKVSKAPSGAAKNTKIK
jgi:hypothetical protein